MEPPKSSNLPVNHLAAAFNDTTNSYKFYWFLAILENVKDGILTIAIDDLIIDMIGEVWYPINYFKLSFGRQDQFEKTIKEIQLKLGCPKDISKQELKIQLIQNKETSEISQLIHRLTRWVPQRFLRPWFTDELRGMQDHYVNRAIIERAERNFVNTKNPSLYRFTKENMIEISPVWKDYMQLHLKILNGFIYWHLINYLQKCNPNVSNITTKLFPPEHRQLSSARKFWNKYITAKGQIKCIYSAQPILIENYSIDHFLPWSFTGHDQLWNLLPTNREVNSSKSDNLPSTNYLEDFVALQYDAFHTVLREVPNRVKLFEDYSILFHQTLNEISIMKNDEFAAHLLNSMKPQLQIAKNMGFQPNWIYQK